MKNAFLRHTLATILYRFKKSLSTTESNFGTFNVGSEARTPNTIINHMYEVLCYARTLITTDQYDAPSIKSLTTITDKAELFNTELAKIDALLTHKTLSFDEAKPLIQGPFSDILTHIGQLSMMSRLHGNPISGEDFSTASIITGIS
ncbi:hypothetical protein [Aquimarina agarilytica]|uniref:hypothetical protein n=1 Tax=Aquimarina agarilytica TaxID=1087449 RepID=UPI000288E1D4|nr:hypothetical protein [Aquimarina agarilytica]